jgi:hypothetical protein
MSTSSTDAAFEDVKKAYLKKFPFIKEIRVYEDHVNFQHVVDVRFLLPEGSIWQFSFPFDQENFVRIPNWRHILYDYMVKGTIEKLYEMGAGITGKYPLVRLYADYHLVGLQTLLFYPEREIPGWIFAKYKKQDEYPEELSAADAQKIFDNRGVKESKDESNIEEPVKKSEMPNPWDVLKEADTVAQTKKRKVTVVKPKINPNRVKKPQCAKHETEMEYSPVDNKWHCTTDGCGMVARPKRDAEDKTLLLGKGGTSLRIVALTNEHKGQVALVLLSDDNIALDVSEYMPKTELADLVSSKDLLAQSQRAAENGQDTFSIPGSVEIVLRLPASVVNTAGMSELEF